MAPGSETHAALQAEIGRQVGNHLVVSGSPCRLLSEPGIVPRVRSHHNFRTPDLAVTCAPPALGAMVPDPILLIEILSPGNEGQTRINILAYTTTPSARETLAVHSTRVEAELLRRNVDGSWPEDPDILNAADMLTLASIDFATSLMAFYQTTALA